MVLQWWFMKNIYFLLACTVDTEFSITLTSLQETEKKKFSSFTLSR